MKKYSSYKDSGYQWLEKIPSHWDVVKTYIITENFDGRRVPLNSEQRSEMTGEIPYWGSNGVVDYIDDYIFDEEIVLVGEDGSPFFDRNKPVSFYVNEKVWVNNHIHILKPRTQIIPKYLTNSFNCVDYKEFITGSTRDKLTQSDLNVIPHTVPPLPEQKKIVSFLDEKTSKIDRLIQSKQRKIDLLKEKRTSLINEVVTKGLNPDVEMKDSGVEWIGEIPSHWEIVKTGYLSQLLTGHPWKSSDFNYKEGIKIVRGENVSEGFLRWGSRTRKWNKKVVKGDTYYLNEGDIVIGMDGSKVGKNYVLITDEDLPLILHQRMCRVRTNEELNPHFLKYFIGSPMFHYYIDISKTDPMVPHITQKNIFDFPVSLPSLEEQREIVDFLEFETKTIDKTLTLEKQKIVLLKEYKQSLISEVVTGKVNVQDEVLV